MVTEWYRVHAFTPVADGGVHGGVDGNLEHNATSDTLLNPTVTAGIDADSNTGASATTSTATLTSIAMGDDTLTGSISIQVGSGTAQTIKVPAADSTLSGLAARHQLRQDGRHGTVLSRAAMGRSSR